jgi:hypothetical protein
MIQLLEFTLNQATIIAIALPIISVCLFILVIPWLRDGSTSKLRRYLSYLIFPPQIGSEISSATEKDSAADWRETKVKLFFYYLGIVLFLVSFVIGEFYEVMFDLTLPVSQGSTGQYRSVTSIVFQTPYNAGWNGALPWSGLVTFHETWNWVYLTSAFTDNPAFLRTLIFVLLLISIGFGFVFLSPLLIKSIRNSFLPSMFFFITGMTLFSKVAIGCLGYALALFLGNVRLDYGMLSATGDMIPGLSQIIVFGFPIVLVMFGFFIVLGRKLWKVYYADTKSRNGFIAYITLSFWLGLIFTILLV